MKILFGFGFLLVLLYTALVALNPRAQEWATSEPTPFDPLNQILALPARLVGETRHAVARNDARVGAPDHVIAADAKGTKGAAGKPVPDPFGSPAAVAGVSPAQAAAAAGVENPDSPVSHEALLASAAKNPAEVAPAITKEAPPASGPAELKLPGGLVVTNRSNAGAPAASISFMYWAASLTVSGVTGTSPARFLMDGRLVREGDEANKQLGITFERVDAAAKLIYFRDKTGAVVTRSY